RFVEITQRPFPQLFRIVSYHNARLKDYLLTRMRCRPEQLLRIEQGVDYRTFNTAGGPIPKTFDVAGKRVAIYTAHLNVASDLEPVLAAWRDVVAQLPDAFLLVVGGERAARYYAASRLDWRAIVAAAEPEIAKRAFPKERS